MNGQPFRNPEGGHIERARPLSFTYDGKRYQGFQGDTLASALLANGVRLVGRSFKYHRPRGVFSAGVEEPNALVQLRTGARTEANTPATTIDLFDGLDASSQNCWPSVGFDVAALTGTFSRLVPPGFYYKTFKWPRSWWLKYEHIIRNASGLGVSATEPDPDRYYQYNAHCDVLVAGGGAAGIAAALTAARTGARVILAEQDSDFGGELLSRAANIDGKSGPDWVAASIAELDAMENVTLLRRSCVFGYYDHNFLAIAERVADHVAEPAPFQPRVRLWHVRARKVVLATGAIERPLVFGENDRPGVMLASAARTYVNRYAVRPGNRAVVFTNNDSAYGAALDLQAAGIKISAIVDVRADGGGAMAAKARDSGIECLNGHVITYVEGTKQVSAAKVMALNAAGDACTGEARTFICDLVCVSGGWNPTVHLYSQSGGKAVFDETLAAFVPGASRQAERSAGACKGSFSLAAALAEGFGDAAVPACDAAPEEAPMRPLWAVPATGHRKRFVDLQNDVGVDDIALAKRENYSSVEHLKRYTALGMGTDQGKTSNVNGLAVLAGILGKDIPEVGTTTFRPPFTPVTMGALVGRELGRHFMPIRRSAMHDWHDKAGAWFVPAGAWLRPNYYAAEGETWMDATNREGLAVRFKVGIVDVSTLGKIDIQGPDSAEFLNRLYINGFKKLEVGKARYGVMLREDGPVFDDGTTTRLAENRYMTTTTTVQAGPVMGQLEFYLQNVWPELDVHVVSVTEEWAAIALAGPKCRDVLAALAEDIDVSNEAFPFMGFREGHLGGIPARVFRISFSGELAYEINVPADYGAPMWEALLEAGKPWDIIPYGTEAMSVMRIEKGHIVSAELDGRATADDLGFGRMLSTKKEFIGKRSLNRPAFVADDRKKLVGLFPADGKTRIPRGAQITAEPSPSLPAPMLGHVTSEHYSANLGKPLALALLKGGMENEGKTFYANSPLSNQSVPVTVTNPVFIDPEGERLRA
jgi:sarcosine oxidase, subunit alpha